MEKCEQPFVSVIIPVFNDGEQLRLCLAALAQQTYAPSQFEVIVVDNDSSDPAPIKAAVEPYPNVTLAFEPTPGSYAARNRGLTLAQGEVIAFTDADCIPAADWLERGVHQLMSNPNCGLVAGHIEVFPQDADHPTAVELFEMATAFPQKHHLQTLKYGATANLFTAKAVIDRVGGFNHELKSGGDLDWGRRVDASGYLQLYAEDVRISHPARASFNQMRQKTVRLAGGHFDLLNRGLYHFFFKDSWLFRLTRYQWVPATLLKSIIFLVILVQDLIPPLMFIAWAWRSPRLRNLNQRIRVALVILFVRYTSAWAKIRLRFGATPARI
jgi:glycosyltransferase involved in cell wall biosynthesis